MNNNNIKRLKLKKILDFINSVYDSGKLYMSISSFRDIEYTFSDLSSNNTATTINLDTMNLYKRYNFNITDKGIGYLISI